MKPRTKLVERRPLLTACLLLLVAERSSHGYELAQRLREWGFADANPGPVYRELRMLEQAGYLRSRYVSPPTGGPVPRVYRLTTSGLRALDQASVDLAEIRELIAEFHSRHFDRPPVL